MICLIWTTSNSPASKVIRWLSGEKVSHMAIVMDSKIVFHSNFYGAHLKWLGTFLKSSKVVHKIALNLTPDQEEAIYQRLVIQFDEQPYDFLALAYWTWAMLKHRLFKSPLPIRNKWGQDQAYLCLELALCLDVLGVHMPVELDMVLPGQLYLILKERLNGYISKS